MKSKIKLKNIKFDSDINFIASDLSQTKNIERIEFYMNNDKFIITPDFGSFRIHKSADDTFGDDSTITIKPGVSNEILVS